MALGDTAGEQREKAWVGGVLPKGPFSMDTPRSEFKETPNPLPGFVQISLFSPSVISLFFSHADVGDIEWSSQYLAPASSPEKAMQIPDLWGWDMGVLLDYGITMDLERTRSYRQWGTRGLYNKSSGLKR